MKTRLFLILALVATLFTSNLTAGNIENLMYLGETTVTISAEPKSIILNLGNIRNEEITISIEDAIGNQLLNEKVKGTQLFVKKYNVAKLEDGNYNLIVTKKTLRTVQPFHVNNHSVEISQLEKKEKFIPVLNQKGNALDVNVLLGNYSNITVSIFDNEGRPVFEEKNYVVFDLHKRYDLSKLPAGVYMVEVMAGDETFYYPVQK